MGGVAATFNSDATSLWVTGESLVHQHQVHGQRSQTVIPMDEVAAVELEGAPDRRLLIGAGGTLAAGLAGGLAATPLIIPFALLGVLVLLVAYDLKRGLRLVVHAPTARVEVRATGEAADRLAGFAKRLEAILQGRRIFQDRRLEEAAGLTSRVRLQGDV